MSCIIMYHCFHCQTISLVPSESMTHNPSDSRLQLRWCILMWQLGTRATSAPAMVITTGVWYHHIQQGDTSTPRLGRGSNRTGKPWSVSKSVHGTRVGSVNCPGSLWITPCLSSWIPSWRSRWSRKLSNVLHGTSVMQMYFRDDDSRWQLSGTW